MGLGSQGAVLGRDPPYSAMILVAAWITEIVLGMVDDRVVPIGDVDRSVGPDLAVDRPEVRVLG